MHDFVSMLCFAAIVAPIWAMAALVDRPLLARVGAARVILQQVDGKPSHAAVSSIQRAALADLLKDFSGCSEGRAYLAEQIAAIQWAGDDALALSNCF